MRVWLMLAGLNGLMAVALGALGAHAFPGDPHGAGLVETASRYQLSHALALIGVAWLASRGRSCLTLAVGVAFTLGLVLFCGSLYITALTSWHPGRLAPFGGGAFMVGWLLLAVRGWRLGRAE